MRGLKGQVVLITGAAGAFGKACTARFLEEGMKVIATDLKLDGIAEGPDVLALRHNVTVEADWNAVVEAGLARFGKIDAFINNAGIAAVSMPQDPETITLEHWRAVNSVNVEGTLLGCQAAMRAMKVSGGVIVNLSSLAALQPSPKVAAYGASKAAVRQLTQTVASYCAQQGYPIRCNSIHPGWIITEMTHLTRTPEEQQAILESIPIRRFGKLDELAGTMAFLLSEEGGYINGSKLVMDGGITWQ